MTDEESGEDEADTETEAPDAETEEEEFGARLGDAYSDTVGSGTRTERSDESVDDAVDAATSMDGVGGGPDKVVSDRGVDDVFAEMGSDDDEDGADPAATAETTAAESTVEDPDGERDAADGTDEAAEAEEGDETPGKESDGAGETDPRPDEESETDEESAAEVPPERSETDGEDAVEDADSGVTSEEVTSGADGEAPSDLADVAPSEAAVKHPAAEVDPEDPPEGDTSEYDEDREDTPSIDDVDLSMDDVDDVSVPDRTPATSDGEAATDAATGGSGEGPAVGSDAGDSATAEPSDEGDSDDAPGPLTRFVRWFGGLFGGN